MVRKSKHEALKTRQDILSSAIAVFLQKGVARATVHEIAQHAHLTRGAVYWHFDDKNDLVSAVFKEAINVVARASEQAAHQSGTNSLVMLKAFFKAPIEQAIHSQEIRDIYTVLMHYCDHGDDAANAFRLIFSEGGHYETHLKKLLNQAITDGHLRLNLDVEASMFMLLSTIHGLTLRYLAPGQQTKFNLPNNLDSIADSVILGLQQETRTEATASNAAAAPGDRY